MSEKDLIFSNSSQEEPQDLDMKKMKNQRKQEKESQAAKDLEKENMKNVANKKKSKNVETPVLLKSPE